MRTWKAAMATYTRKHPRRRLRLPTLWMGEQRTSMIERIVQRVEEHIEEEAHQPSAEEVMKEHRVAFVVHSEEVAQTLEAFAGEKDRLIRVIPSTRGSYAKEMGIKGSWLVFEKSD
jgi:hypothetical protein